MLKIKNPVLAMFAFMAIVEAVLSVIFNLLVTIGVLHQRMSHYFVFLALGTLVLYVLTGWVMRSMRCGLITEVNDITGEENNETHAENRVKDYMLQTHTEYNTKKYYRINLTACAMLSVLNYLMRIVFGPGPFKWTCAISDFANFAGLFANVYLAIGIFSAMLFATVFAAQIGVVGRLKKQKAENVEKRKMRMVHAKKTTNEFRDNRAKGVDVLGMVTRTEHRPEDEEAVKHSEALRREKREGVDVLGMVTRTEHRPEDEEAVKRSEALRREKREGVDVLGAVITNNLDPDEKY